MTQRNTTNHVIANRALPVTIASRAVDFVLVSLVLVLVLITPGGAG
jgi:hypothetical protein